MSADIKTVELTIALPPRKIGQERKAIEFKLNQLKSRYVAEADGVLLNWHDLEVLNDKGIIIDDQPFVYWKITFTAHIFKPIEGKIIKGRIQTLLPKYFLAVTMGSFTATVTISDSLIDSPVVQNLKIQNEVYFRIKGYAEGVYRAELDEECLEMTNNLADQDLDSLESKVYDYAKGFEY